MSTDTRDEEMVMSNLHALRIGIDHCFPNGLADGGCCGNLGGSVRDGHTWAVEQIEIDAHRPAASENP